MALSGRQTNGLEYVEQALAEALPLLPGKGSARPSAAPAIVWFDEARRDMATLSARVTNHPQEELEIVAVTGTNGKDVRHNIASWNRSRSIGEKRSYWYDCNSNRGA